MKFFLRDVILLFSLFSSLPLQAQNRNNIWAIGYGSEWEGTIEELDFQNHPPSVFQASSPLNFFNTDAGICDTNGNLLFYTNGIYIANRKNDSLQNCENFNPGSITTFYGDVGLGYTQGALVLPMPGDSNKYYAFSVSGEFIKRKIWNKPQPLNLFYSVIDMRLDSGYGGIIDSLKAKSAVNDTLLAGYITACKHANGRDWWIVVHKVYSDLFYKVLLTPKGIAGVYTQHIGVPVNVDFYGRSVFSPDGSKYAIVWYSDSAEVLDFDRCTGEFSNPEMVQLPDTSYGYDSLAFLACAISPDNRYLYADNNLDLWQLDLQNPNLASSIKLAGRYDTSNDQVDLLYDMQVAPDNKIYISTYNGSFNLEVINYPDSIGMKCGYVQNGFALPNPSFTIPNLPNYDLGPLIGSDCDTLTAIRNTRLPEFHISIYPNPVKQWLTISYQAQQNLQCEIFDITGRMVNHFTLYPYFRSRMYDVSDLASGIYILQAMDEKGNTAARKIMKE